jgi:hypothetical protein
VGSHDHGPHHDTDDDEDALAWIREALGDEITDLATPMPRTSPMTE